MKKTKIFWKGKRLKDVYVGAKWYQVLWYRICKFFRKVVLLAILFLIFYVAGQFIRAYYPVIKYERIINEVKAQEIVKDTLNQKIEALKWEVIDGIKSQESKGYSEDDGLIIFDPLQSNPSKTARKNIPSIGSYQFKQKTIKDYYKKLYNKDITMKEAAIIALDDEQSRQLAYDIVWKDNGLYANWKNYAIKESTKVKLSIIKELQ